MTKSNIQLAVAAALMTCACSGCFLAKHPERLVTLRRPWQMIDTPPSKPPPIVPPPSTPLPSAPPPTVASEDADMTQEESNTASQPTAEQRAVEPAFEAPDATPAEAIERARQDATQQPSSEGFVAAVQLYDFESGGIYEVLTAPGFVTVLRLRVGEEVTRLAAGDTSRWLIDMIASGVADPQAVLSNNLRVEPGPPQTMRVSVLIKPRRPLIETNLIIATTQRTYLIDLKSVDTSAHHSAVEWTYPQEAVIAATPPRPRAVDSPESTTRNYAYEIKAPPGILPPWTPVSVFDDGRRVYVRFPKSIDHHRRPPLFIVESDGAVRLVNYHVDDKTYVIHELFDRAELRLGGQRVVIDRVKPESPNPIAWLQKKIGLTN